MKSCRLLDVPVSLKQLQIVRYFRLLGSTRNGKQLIFRVFSTGVPPPPPPPPPRLPPTPPGFIYFHIDTYIELNKNNKNVGKNCETVNKDISSTSPQESDFDFSNVPATDVCLLVGCFTSQQQASVSQGRICLDNFTGCHTEIEVADPTFYLTQSQYADTGPTSPSADPITPGAWQGSHWSADFLSHWYDSTPKKSRHKRDSNPGSSALEADALTTRPTRRSQQQRKNISGKGRCTLVHTPSH